jgi:hypothetical protein
MLGKLWNKLREFVGLCPHDWSKWEVKKVFVSQSHGVTQINSTRYCWHCGEIQTKES